MKDKIKLHYKLNFSSSPIEIDDNKIDFIIANDCSCSDCNTSIFEMDDFPELSIKDDYLLCMDCYDNKYREICPICEESYDTKDFVSDYFVIPKESAKDINIKAGIYKIIKRPFYYGNILFGFEFFFDDAIQLIVSIDIAKYNELKYNQNEVITGKMCPDCIDRFVRKSNYLKSDSIPIILMKKYESDKVFLDYSTEGLHKARQILIHKRITCRGMIEQGNKVINPVK